MAKHLEVVPFIAIPSGYTPCIACSDFKTQPGRMWLGYSRCGEDLTITCPVCKGTAQVEKFKHIDLRTGKEIDYEAPGQRFVNADDLKPGQLISTFSTGDDHGA
jgi:hypothetical protein